MDKNGLLNSRILKFPQNNRANRIFLAQRKTNLESFKSTPNSLKQHSKAFEKKLSLGVPDSLRALNIRKCPIQEVLIRATFAKD